MIDFTFQLTDEEVAAVQAVADCVPETVHHFLERCAIRILVTGCRRALDGLPPLDPEDPLKPVDRDPQN